MRKAVRTVAMLQDIFFLDRKQHVTHLLRRVMLVVEKADEVADGALKVDIVFPKRIVGVDQQRLG